MKKGVVKDSAKVASFMLRAALAIPFLYAAIAATLQPEAWIGFMPSFIVDLLPASILLGTFSLYQASLSIWLLSGKKTKYAAGLAALTLLVITATNISALYIVFRDVGLMLAALALHALHHNTK